MEIRLAKCVLREWRDGDQPSLAKHADNPRVAQNLVDAFPNPYTLADADRWVAKNSRIEPQRAFAVIIDGEACGGIGFEPGTDIRRRSAELGYWLGEAHWGRGVMTEAVRAVVEYAFRNFDLEHVFAGLFAHNLASARVLEKAGFTFEGRLRRHMTKNGTTMDDLIYGIIRSEALPS